jgi:hypothetical protein
MSASDIPYPLKRLPRMTQVMRTIFLTLVHTTLSLYPLAFGMARHYRPPSHDRPSCIAALRLSDA